MIKESRYLIGIDTRADDRGAHFFTRGPVEDLTGMECEPDAFGRPRGEVLTDHGCFAAPPAGC